MADNQGTIDINGIGLAEQAAHAGEKRSDTRDSLNTHKLVGASPEDPERHLKTIIGVIEHHLALLKAVVDGIEDGIVLLDATGRILYANQKARKYSGRGQDEIRGKTLDALNMLPPQAMPQVFSLLIGVLSGQAVQPFRVDTCGASGETVPMEMHLCTVREGEEVIGARVTIRGTTSQGREAVAGRSGEYRCRSAAENGIDWVWEANEKNVYTYVSVGVRDILGYEPQEVLGKTIFDLVPMGEMSRATKTVGTAISARKPLKLVQMNCLRKDGRTVSLETNASPVFDSAGRFSGYQGIHRDITGRGQSGGRFEEDLVKLGKTVDGITQATTLIVEVRDPYTAGHQRRTSHLGSAIVKEMHDVRARMPDLDRIVRTAALLHDLGKVFIPAEILTKPGQLTQDELAIIRNHPKAGYEILKNIEFPWPIAEIVLQHHERLDGSGYPSGLKGDDIHIEARIIGVADVVEAMVHPRSYRPALGLDNALSEIAKGKGILYDQDVVEACLSVFLDRGFKFQSQ